MNSSEPYRRTCSSTLAYESLDEAHRRLLEVIDPAKEDKILVIGTGAWPKIETLLHSIYGCEDITSGDVDYRNIESAKRALPKLNFIYLDAQKPFPLTDKSFDKVIFTDVLEHLAEEDIALSEIRRVLKTRGALVISVPKKRWFNVFSPVTWIQHKREYSEDSLSNVLRRNGFRITSMFPCGSVYMLFNLWLHLIYKYVLRKLRTELFFRRRIDQHCRKDFTGKGVDIIARAEIDS